MKLLPFIIAFVAGMISKVWVIRNYAMVVPNNDQWYVDFKGMFLPMQSGTFHLSTLIEPWQEHRLLFNRLLDLAQFAVLGRFDNIIQCHVNAVLHCGIICGFGMALVKLTGEKSRPWIAMACFAILAVPFGWENTANGIQSQIYFLFAATALSAWLFATGRFRLGLAASLCGCFTMATGWLAAAAFSAVLVLDYFRQAPSRERLLVLGMRLSPLAAVCIIGQCLTPHCPWNDPAKAHTAGEAVDRLARYASWPGYFMPWLFIITLAPAAVLLWQWLRHPKTHDSPEWFILVCYGVAAAQAMGLAVMRANGHNIYISRYQDLFAPILVLGVACLFLLATRYRMASAQWLSGAWATACAIGLVTTMQMAKVDGLPHYRAAMDLWTRNTQIMAATHNPRLFDRVPAGYLPCTSADDFAELTANTNVLRWIIIPNKL